jgi:hypothetical protein
MDHPNSNTHFLKYILKYIAHESSVPAWQLSRAAAPLLRSLRGVGQDPPPPCHIGEQELGT